jgi:hypothetical protein
MLRENLLLRGVFQPWGSENLFALGLILWNGTHLVREESWTIYAFERR